MERIIFSNHTARCWQDKNKTLTKVIHNTRNASHTHSNMVRVLCVKNANFNNISIVLWWSVLVVVETGIDKNTTVNGHNCLSLPIFLYTSFKTHQVISWQIFMKFSLTNAKCFEIVSSSSNNILIYNFHLFTTWTRSWNLEVQKYSNYIVICHLHFVFKSWLRKILKS